jgi:hypothetical protein
MIWFTMSKAEKSDAIRAGVAEGLSASEIGERHGCTRNVIIGHSHRYGPRLTPPRVATADARTLRSERHYRTYVPRRPSKPVTERPAPRRAPQPRVQAPPLVPAPIHQPEPLAAPVTFSERLGWQCSWPVSGEPGPAMLCCGEPVAVQCYCGKHWAKSRAKGPTYRIHLLDTSKITGAWEAAE